MSVYKGRFFQAYIVLIAVVVILNHGENRGMNFAVNAAPVPYGLEDLTRPAVEGVVNPLGTGVGRGVAGAAAGTQQTADLLGDAIDTLLHTLGGIAGNADQGAGVAVANAAPAVQSTVHAIQHNDGALGDVATIVGGN
ncbi:hypothetical protein EMPS_09932 [Entomortierella parvispora]|uniref:Uncharacterized protein n=1 Tax=Entomortierella parvispora TaxID=205924 RepID=A0A9P3M0S6_9FUNG|nr:hypothetical protein EMPS_09932 [Entomortierella parvispora]